MQRFEITIDGQVQPGDFATRDEADAAASRARQDNANKDKMVAVRTKADTATKTDDAARKPRRESIVQDADAQVRAELDARGATGKVDTGPVLTGNLRGQQKGEPVYDANGTLIGNRPAGGKVRGPQGTPGNPAGAVQRR